MAIMLVPGSTCLFMCTAAVKSRPLSLYLYMAILGNVRQMSAVFGIARLYLGKFGYTRLQSRILGYSQRRVDLKRYTGLKTVDYGKDLLVHIW